MKKFLSSLFLLPLAIFADEAPGGQSNITQLLMMFGLAIVFFYFILWRPEQKRRKAAEQMRSAMKKGDRVTAMGIIGTIDQIKEQTIVIKLIEGAKVEMLKAAITEVQSSSSEG